MKPDMWVRIFLEEVGRLRGRVERQVSVQADAFDDFYHVELTVDGVTRKTTVRELVPGSASSAVRQLWPLELL